LVPIGIPWYPLVSIEDVVDAINSCKRERHHAQIRFRRFDSVEHVQTAGFIVKKWFELHLIPPGSVQFSRSQQYARLFNPASVTSKALLLVSPASFLSLGHQQGSSAWTINKALSAWATNKAVPAWVTNKALRLGPPTGPFCLGHQQGPPFLVELPTRLFCLGHQVDQMSHVIHHSFVSASCTTYTRVLRFEYNMQFLDVCLSTSSARCEGTGPGPPAAPPKVLVWIVHM